MTTETKKTYSVQYIRSQVLLIMGELITDLPDPNDIGPQSNLRNIGVDSLDLVELGLNCEQHFEITISDVDFESIVTFGDLVNVIEETLKTKGQ